MWGTQGLIVHVGTENYPLFACLVTALDIMIMIMIYLSTAIGLTPGGSGTVHTINT